MPNKIEQNALYLSARNMLSTKHSAGTKKKHMKIFAQLAIIVFAVASLSATAAQPSARAKLRAAGKLTTSKLVQKLGLKTAQVLERAATAGYVEALGDGRYGPTAKGEQAGVEYVAKSRFGPYFLWPVDVQLG
jgi:hypothetical protein